MAINFTDSPADGATQVISGKTYTYNSAKNKWDTTATEVTGPTAAVYAAVDNLPTSGNITGSQAFVSGTNRLYIWNGSGWYNIALINNNPSISGVASSYALAIDGTATTVTIVATDPEGLPITYSIASDTSASTATVAQGTGSNTNVFTITPSTNSAHAGTFSLTFRASDGVNLATAVSSFTLQFKVVNQKYTTALITSVGANNAVNNSFDDKSTNDHTITAVGNATQTTFSPYRHGGYSTYFDGTTDYLKVTDSAEHAFGTGDFSIEFWWWPETVTGNSGNIHIMISAPNDSHNQLIYNESTYWYYGAGSGGAVQVNSSGNGPATAKAWNHVVLCRTGTTMSIFHNGTRTGSVTSSYSADFSNASIGRYDSGGYEVDGYVRDMRWLKGSSAYDATQTSITLPTEPLTAITNTTLLTCHLPYIADGSTTGHTITVNGNTKTLPFAPYDALEYSAADHGGSMYFDGTGDYLSIADHADLDMGSSDFTIEGWYYPVVTPGGSNGLLSKRANSSEANGILIYFGGTSTGQPSLLVAQSGSWAINTASSITFKTGQWNHFAIVRNGTSFKLYINGKAGISVTSSITVTDNGHPFIIGTMGADGSNVLAESNISDFRVVKGTAVYTANFTPPTAPLTAITNTSLLLQSTDAGIIDKSQSVKSLTLNGDVKSSTTQTKYLSSSMYFDGTGDYLNISSSEIHALGGGDYTVECWVYLNSSKNQGIWDTRTTNTSTTGVALYVTSGNEWRMVVNNSTFTVGGSITNSTWTHVAVVRSGSTITVYVAGSSVNTATSSINLTDESMLIATLRDNVDTSATFKLDGYMSDFRVTKGLARYTANFTPPTAALPG
jgi:hypothetical protein